MSDIDGFKMERDVELGAALREALAPHHDGAFVTRIRARLVKRGQSWDEQLASWFWRGLATATVATVMAGLGLSRVSASTLDEPVAEASIASQLLLGAQPGVDVILVSMRDPQ